MHKVTRLLCALAVSTVVVASGISPATATTATPSAGSTATATPSAAPTSNPTTTPSATGPTPSAAPTSTPTTAPSTTPSATGPTPSAIASSTGSKSLGQKLSTGITAPVAQALATVKAPGLSDTFVAKVLARTNEYRAQNGAGPLVLNSSIGSGSQQWALSLNAQINKGTLDMAKLHRTDAGASILPAGADMYSEIIGINGTAEQIVDWWIASPSHRAALLDKRATDLGLGYVKTSQAAWSGMTVVVGNLAGYPASRAKQPQPAVTPVFQAGDIAAVDAAGNLFAYPSAKGGDLWKRNVISAGWAGAKQLSVVDYNNDGRQDLIAVWSDGRLTVSYGQANGTLAAVKRIGTGWGSMDVVVTKWTSGSVYPAIVAKDRATGQLFLYPNLDGTRFGTRQLIGTGWGSLTIMAADFDGDKKQDLLARNTAGQLLLYRSNGKGNFLSEKRRVVGTGWGSMAHISGIAGHVGTGSYGVLARSTSGNLYYYPILKNGWGAKLQIGTGGWQSLKLGS